MDISLCDDYDANEDFIYLNCSFPKDFECWQLTDLHTAWYFRTSPMVIIIIILSVFALLFNLIYTILIHIVWVREKFKGHKRDIFVANRSIITIFTLSILYTTLILWQTYGFGYTTTSILLVIAACDYMVIACNFFIVTILMYVAVMNPIFYSTRLRFWHCIAIGWGFSLVAMFIGVIVGLRFSALFFPSESFFECPVDSCQFPFAVSILSILGVGYLLMMVCYSIVILKLRKRIDKLALFSLRFSFGIITTVFIPMNVIFIVVVINFDNFSALGDFSADPCSRLEKSSTLLLCCYLVASTVICWLIGMITDPLFNIITEAKFYDHFSTFQRLKVLVTPKRTPTKFSTTSSLIKPLSHTCVTLPNVYYYSSMDLSSCTEYDPNRDNVYLNCSIIEDACAKLKDLHYASNFGDSPMVIVAIVLSVIAFVLHLFYSILIHIVWVREKFKGNKRSAIVADRSATAIFTIILFYVTLILWHTIGFGYTTASILLVIAACVYMWIANNFFLMTIMLYLAVMKPIFYSKKLKFNHCLILRWSLWVVVISLGIVFGLGASSLFFPSDSIFPCPVQTCQYPFAITVLSLLCGGFVLMLIFYVVIMLKLRKRIHTLAKFSMRVSFGVIMIVYLSAITTYTIAVINIDDIAGLGEKFESPCTRLESGSTLLLCCNIFGATAICWLIGMTIDSIFNLVTEATFCEHFSAFRRLKAFVKREKPTLL